MTKKFFRYVVQKVNKSCRSYVLHPKDIIVDFITSCYFLPKEGT